MNLQELKTALKGYIGLINIKGYITTEKDKDGNIIYEKKSDYLVNVGYTYANAKKDDIFSIERDKIDYKESSEYTLEDWNLARQEKLQSLISPSENRSNAQKEAYVSLNELNSLKWFVGNENKELLPSIKINALVVRETLITKIGQRKEVKSSPKTKAKKQIEYQLKVSKIRTFTLDKIENLKVNGETLEITL